MTTFGLLIFDGAEELDFVGPWEVFTASAMLQAESGAAADTCMTIAEHAGPIRCAKGLRVVADHGFSDHPPLDVLLVPGGVGARRGVSNATLTGWIGKTAAEASWVTGVCTGALLLHEAGPARGRRVATHHAYEDALAARGEVTVVRDARYVVDGNLVTSQGVSAGIDLADRMHAPCAVISSTTRPRPTSPTSRSPDPARAWRPRARRAFLTSG
jgi:transcriptional regulator GlxA family with amidase domain